MRTLAAAVLASLAIVTSGVTIVGVTEQASFVQSSHTDAWCNEHFIGSGKENCLKHKGCCFSQVASGIFDNTQELGPCHSCDAHQDEWCQIYGDEGLDACLELGGACHFDVVAGRCNSAEPDALFAIRSCVDVAADNEGAKEAYVQCMGDIDIKYNNTENLGEGRDASGTEVWRQPVSLGGCAELYYYTPACTTDDDGRFFEAYQADEDGIGPNTYFCVDQEGNEIADTRKATPEETWDVRCKKLRMLHAGMQCPNANSLYTKGGFAVDNAAAQGDCTSKCNTDQDCAGETWCCINDCGSECQLAIKPMASCGTDKPLGAFQTMAWAEGQGTELGCLPGKGGEACTTSVGEEHGTRVLLTCQEGFSATSVTNPSVNNPKSTDLQCRHGHWESLSGERVQEVLSNVVCKKSCDPYNITGNSAIDGKPLRESDFHISHGLNTHGSITNVTCADEYGVVSGTKEVHRFSSEPMECNEGTWETSDGGPQTIECSVCYDKSEYEWRDENSKSCTLYSQRPMLCNDNEEAIENCRVSCRSCLEAERKYKIRTTIDSLDAVPEARKNHWTAVGKRVKVARHHTVLEERLTKVRLLKTEVCVNPYDSKVRKLSDGSCPEGYSPMV